MMLLQQTIALLILIVKISCLRLRIHAIEMRTDISEMQHWLILRSLFLIPSNLQAMHYLLATSWLTLDSLWEVLKHDKQQQVELFELAIEKPEWHDTVLSIGKILHNPEMHKHLIANITRYQGNLFGSCDLSSMINFNPDFLHFLKVVRDRALERDIGRLEWYHSCIFSLLLDGTEKGKLSNDYAILSRTSLPISEPCTLVWTLLKLTDSLLQKNPKSLALLHFLIEKFTGHLSPRTIGWYLAAMSPHKNSPFNAERVFTPNKLQQLANYAYPNIPSRYNLYVSIERRLLRWREETLTEAHLMSIEQLGLTRRNYTPRAFLAELGKARSFEGNFILCNRFMHSVELVFPDGTRNQYTSFLDLIPILIRQNLPDHTLQIQRYFLESPMVTFDVWQGLLRASLYHLILFGRFGIQVNANFIRKSLIPFDADISDQQRLELQRDPPDQIGDIFSLFVREWRLLDFFTVSELLKILS